jgi:hypothetical protein
MSREDDGRVSDKRKGDTEVTKLEVNDSVRFKVEAKGISELSKK